MGPSGTSSRSRAGDGSPDSAAQREPPPEKTGAAPVYVQMAPVGCQVAGSMRCIVDMTSKSELSALLDCHGPEGAVEDLRLSAGGVRRAAEVDPRGRDVNEAVDRGGVDRGATYVVRVRE